MKYISKRQRKRQGLPQAVIDQDSGAKGQKKKNKRLPKKAKIKRSHNNPAKLLDRTNKFQYQSSSYSYASAEQRQRVQGPLLPSPDSSQSEGSVTSSQESSATSTSTSTSTSGGDLELESSQRRKGHYTHSGQSLTLASFIDPELLMRTSAGKFSKFPGKSLMALPLPPIVSTLRKPPPTLPLPMTTALPSALPIPKPLPSPPPKQLPMLPTASFAEWYKSGQWVSFVNDLPEDPDDISWISSQTAMPRISVLCHEPDFGPLMTPNKGDGVPPPEFWRNPLSLAVSGLDIPDKEFFECLKLKPIGYEMLLARKQKRAQKSVEEQVMELVKWVETGAAAVNMYPQPMVTWPPYSQQRIHNSNKAGSGSGSGFHGNQRQQKSRNFINNWWDNPFYVNCVAQMEPFPVDLMPEELHAAQMYAMQGVHFYEMPMPMDTVYYGAPPPYVPYQQAVGPFQPSMVPQMGGPPPGFYPNRQDECQMQDRKKDITQEEHAAQARQVLVLQVQKFGNQKATGAPLMTSGDSGASGASGASGSSDNLTDLDVINFNSTNFPPLPVPPKKRTN
ncbi:hypothetical protein M5D96_012123 [Drosophila gunungcola]|uniref:Uncharacterized protein n=1 Tax=Drosophila gunungcola TaxID=103775 RepID=A0A9Q0BKJ7_9MUSC|nr:hypothetical protein M5D96_012123 [Drosophila gunungcola]